MKLPPLVPGTLLRRYKRLLADVKLDSGPVVTAHCPNTGSMLGCSEPGRRDYISRHDSPTRKYPCTWQLIRMPGTLVGVNSMPTNHLVREAIDAAQICGLKGFPVHRAEPSVAAGKRTLRPCPSERLTNPSITLTYCPLRNRRRRPMVQLTDSAKEQLDRHFEEQNEIPSIRVYMAAG